MFGGAQTTDLDLHTEYNMWQSSSSSLGGLVKNKTENSSTQKFKQLFNFIIF